jgi:hypothetical protein
MLNVADAKLMKLYIDDEPFALEFAHLLEFERVLDMRAGTLERCVLWETPSGKRVTVRSTRLVSFTHRHLAAVRYEVTVHDEGRRSCSNRTSPCPSPPAVSRRSPPASRLQERVLLAARAALRRPAAGARVTAPATAA